MDCESTSRLGKLLRTVNILYSPSLFVSAIGGQVKRLADHQDMPTVHTVRTISTGREPIHDPTNCYKPYKYALRFVSICLRSRWLGKALLNRQLMPTIRTVRTIRTDRKPIHDASQIVRRAVVE